MAKPQSGNLFDDIIETAGKLGEKRSFSEYRSELKKIPDVKITNIDTTSFGVRVKRGEEEVFVKRDYHANELKDRLGYIFINNALYSLGIGAKVEFKKDADEDLITISRGLANSKNPESNRQFSEGDVKLSSDEAAKEKAVISAVADFFNLKDLKTGTYTGKRAGTYERLNYGMVSKEGASDKIKIFDFLLTDEKYETSPEQIKILQDLAKSSKLSPEGEFAPKSWRQKHEERAGLGKIIEATYEKTLATYQDVYGEQPPQKALERLDQYKESLMQKINRGVERG